MKAVGIGISSYLPRRVLTSQTDQVEYYAAGVECSKCKEECANGNLRLSVCALVQGDTVEILYRHLYFSFRVPITYYLHSSSTCVGQDQIVVNPCSGKHGKSPKT
jgi:hypothetical protein